MSDIVGNGYGSEHDWQRGYTSPYKSTTYTCRRCKASFSHCYDDVPDIFVAMKLVRVPEHCTAPQGEP